MASNEMVLNASVEIVENPCVVCFKNVEIYSIGICDHPVCFECSTRMRVLCCQNECPICRGEMSKVIFTEEIDTFNNLYAKYEKINLYDHKYGLIFTNIKIQKSYQKLLEYRCIICETNYQQKQQRISIRYYIFNNFQQLKDHMRREHSLSYCDLCVENLKIFSFERKCYTRQELGYHRRKGDVDNTSHRGHPLCEFCDQRFMDSDDLFRHLRRNHLFCDICDADGKHQYYNSMNDLKKHFKDEHYLCEEGDCKNMPLLAVFRTDIDLKAHITSEHRKNMSKSATKQARTLELEFTLAPRQRPDSVFKNKRGGGNPSRFYRDDEEGAIGGFDLEPEGFSNYNNNNKTNTNLFINPLTSQDFPALGSGNNNSNIIIHNRPTTTTLNFSTTKPNHFSSEDFPTLGGTVSRVMNNTGTVTIQTNSTTASAVTKNNNNSKTTTPEVTIIRTVRGGTGGGGDQGRLIKNSQNFPNLVSGSNSNTTSTVRLSVNNSQNINAPKVSIQLQNPNGTQITTHITTTTTKNTTTNLQKNNETFPVLAGSSMSSIKNLNQPKWVQVQSKNVKKQQTNENNNKMTKVAPTPKLLSTNDLNQFPTLNNKNSKNNKSSSVTVPVVLNSSVSNNNNKKNNNTTDLTLSKQNIGTSSSVSTSNSDSKLLQTNNESKNNKNKKKKNIKNNSNNENNKNSALVIVESNNRKDDLKNGTIKKRSELKIGKLKEPINSTTTTNTITNSSSNKKQINNEVKPPPGFKLKPPPGFSNNNNQVLSDENFPLINSTTNDLTFTNSSGKSYTIKPSINNNNYKAPNNFQQRNHNLIKKILNHNNNDERLIQEFKKYSDLFRYGNLKANEFYLHCKSFLNNNFNDIFSELLVLPDINKQNELYIACCNDDNNKLKLLLLVCETCKQIIFKNELTQHYKYHQLDNQFPSLESTLANNNNNIWKKS